jgi:hypothetical protein
MKVILVAGLLTLVACSIGKDDDYPLDMYCHEDGGEWDSDHHCCKGSEPAKYDRACPSR